jgi:hypothetical protein
MKRKLMESCKLFRERGTVCMTIRRRKRRRSCRSPYAMKDEILKVTIANE